jgi:hypothetical protein
MPRPAHTRTIDMSPELAKCVKLASIATGMSGQAFISAAIQSVVMTMADHDVAVACLLKTANCMPKALV